jgi:hypothetical protein
MANLIQKSLPRGFSMIRIHVSGDFWSETYFLAWLNVALNNPLVTFYGYTKALPHLVKFRKYIPNNFRFTASKGGTCDPLISKHRLKYAEVVFSLEEAADKGLEIDHDDTHAYGESGSFALLLHGTQPPNTAAGRALIRLQRDNLSGYGEATKEKRTTPERPLVVYVTIQNGEIVRPLKPKKKPIIKPSFIYTPKINGWRFNGITTTTTL